MKTLIKMSGISGVLLPIGWMVSYGVVHYPMVTIISIVVLWLVGAFIHDGPF